MKRLTLRLILLPLLLVPAGMLIFCRKTEPVKTYDEGFHKGVEWAAKCFTDTNAYLAPLNVSNNCVISNCLFVYIIKAPDSLLTVGGSVSNVSISHCQLWTGW